MIATSYLMGIFRTTRAIDSRNETTAARAAPTLVGVKTGEDGAFDRFHVERRALRGVGDLRLDSEHPQNCRRDRFESDGLRFDAMRRTVANPKRSAGMMPPATHRGKPIEKIAEAFGSGRTRNDRVENSRIAILDRATRMYRTFDRVRLHHGHAVAPQREQRRLDVRGRAADDAKFFRHDGLHADALDPGKCE